MCRHVRDGRARPQRRDPRVVGQRRSRSRRSIREERHLAALRAKAFAGRLATVGDTAIQVFGGIGYTWEHDAHLYLKRLLSWSAFLGGPDRLPHRTRCAPCQERPSVMDIDYLLNATRSARKSLDLNAPVDLDDIRDCLRNRPAGG